MMMMIVTVTMMIVMVMVMIMIRLMTMTMTRRKFLEGNAKLMKSNSLLLCCCRILNSDQQVGSMLQKFYEDGLGRMIVTILIFLFTSLFCDDFDDNLFLYLSLLYGIL